MCRTGREEFPGIQKGVGAGYQLFEFVIVLLLARCHCR